jgi:hypothetical protein
LITSSLMPTSLSLPASAPGGRADRQAGQVEDPLGVVAVVQAEHHQVRHGPSSRRLWAQRSYSGGIIRLVLQP